MKKDHAVPNHNSHSRNPHDTQAEKIRADTLTELPKGSKVDLKKVRSGFIVYLKSKGHCLNCGKSNHETSSCGVGPVDSRVYPNIVSQLYQQSQQHDVHKNISKLKEYVKDSYGIKLVPDTTVPIPKAVESKMKYKPQKIEFNIPTELTNVDDKNYTRLNSNKELINDEEDELLHTIKFDKENKENMDKPKIIINSHSKEEQFKLILDTGSNVSLINALKTFIRNFERYQHIPYHILK
ncbi:hypothetical protein ACTFIW_008778 [Dictyostelium discoideum]